MKEPPKQTTRRGTARWDYNPRMVSGTDRSSNPEQALDIRLVVDRIPTLAWSSHWDGSVDFVNQRWQEYTGLSREQSYGRGWKVAIHPDDLRALVEKWEVPRDADTAYECEVRLRRSDGLFRWFLLQREPLRGVAGDVIRWYGIATDNEQRKQALEQVQKSEARLRQVIDTIPTLAWCNLAAGPNEFLNKAWHEYTGLSPEESHGWGWQATFHPEDLPPLMERWRELLISGEPGEIEARIRRHDGAYRWFLIRVQPFRDEAGKIVRWYGTSTDVEDRKQAEKALQASERELRSIISAIPTLAWSAAPDGSADFLNQRWLDYAGLAAEQAAGWGWAEAIHPDDRKRLVEYWQSCLASGVPVETEARMRRFDAAYRWFLFRANPLRDEMGKIIKWYGTNIDIEDRKQREEALRASELSWRDIVDNIPGLVATTGAMGEVEFLNRQTLEYFGKTTEDLKNWALIGAVHPDDLPHVIEARKKSIEAGQIYEVEHRCRRADGIYRWFQVRGLPVRNAEGTITSWYLLLTDIEDRKKAEETLQSNERNLNLMINAIPAFIHVLRTDGSVLYANKAVLDYTGLTLEDVRKEDYRARIFHPEDVERLREERREALKGTVPFENEQRVLGQDGKYRWFLVRYNPLVEEGRVTRWYVSATEIESRKQEEERVRQENARLEERTRIARELHDTLLQTCLGALLQLGGAVESLPADSQIKSKFNPILQSMELGIEEGRKAIQGLRSSGSGPLDLVAALSAVRLEFSTQPGVDFRTTVVGQQQPLRSAIQQEVYRLGREALLNAFCHSGAKRIDLELEYADSLTIRIRDNGCGIDPRVLDTGRKGHWGLAGMRERAARIGGLLKISSNAIAGTEIKLFIPSDVAFQASPANLGRMEASP
jgi:PAS domain S-box-containing protein